MSSLLTMVTDQIDLSEKLAKDSQNKWDVFSAASKSAGITLPKDQDLLITLKQIFSFSDFIARGLTRNPELLRELMERGDLKRKYESGEYIKKVKRALSDPCPPENEKQLSRALRRLRLREMIRIAWRDLAGWTDLTGTVNDLSEFADACLNQALSLLYDWQCKEYGIPCGVDGSRQYLVVIAMGKLGGHELNFSSDVDLIFAFPEAGKTKDGPKYMGNEEFFTRLCRRLIKAIGATTSDGFVFRVDMRLRPFGESGPIVMSFDGMEEYYQIQGREWERYAWIKARPVAGDKDSGTRLLARLKPFVYRKYLDFGVFESLREMKQKITLEVKRKGMEDNIKLGPGGIREVEFFCQMFQLTRGGVTPVLQESCIRKVLSVLSQEKYIPPGTRDELLDAYEFLRNTEHRLQEFSDQQTHELPSDPVGRERLSTSMGFSDWSAFNSRLRQHMECVHDHFNKLLGSNESTDLEDDRNETAINELSSVWEAGKRHERDEEVLFSAGFKDPDKVMHILENLRNDPATRALSSEGRTRLDKLVPLVLKEVGLSEHPDLVLNRIIDLIKTIERRTNYLSLLLENPTALVHLVKLADSSPWIASFLALHPVLLDELLDRRTLYLPPERQDIESAIRKRLDKIPPNDLESQMIELCIFRHVNTLRVAAADVAGTLPLMRISDYLTDIAEIIINEVLNLAWNHLVQKHGMPACLLDGKACEKGFSVIAYGKLGGFELGYGSDLDLVFVHAGAEGQTEGDSHPIDSPHFFTRLGQRIIHMLTASTSAGILYETDLRLRPDGSSGLLVVNMESFREYQKKKAWTWEHQALIKARAICGDPLLQKYFGEIRKEILARKREKSRLKEEVINMRKRMQKELLKSEPGVFDIKQDQGGLVDIEFLVQYLVLLNAYRYPELTQWTDIVRLLQTLDGAGIIDHQVGQLLKEAYLTFRSMVHKLSLQGKPARISDNRFPELRKEVLKVWNDHLSTGECPSGV